MICLILANLSRKSHPVMSKADALGFARSGRISFQRYHTSSLKVACTVMRQSFPAAFRGRALNGKTMTTIGGSPRSTSGASGGGRPWPSRRRRQRSRSSSQAAVLSRANCGFTGLALFHAVPTCGCVAGFEFLWSNRHCPGEVPSQWWKARKKELASS